jgi:hypothetical protein
MKKVVDVAQQSAAETARQLEEVTTRAEAASRRLELTMATTHDIPRAAGQATSSGRTVRRRRRHPSETVDEIMA